MMTVAKSLQSIENASSQNASVQHAFPQVVWDRTPAPRHVGLALGGGAARGFAHIGVLQVLEEAGIPIHMVVGCSAGAIVGALLAAGIPARLQYELVRGLRWHTLSTLSLLPHGLSSLNFSLMGFPLGLLDLDKLILWLEGLLGDALEFDQLHLPFAAIATDIVTSEMVIMNEGAVGPAVRASCSVPGLFTPYRRGDRLLVDGGVVANLPVEVVRQMGAEYVIAVNLLPLPGVHQQEPENILDLGLTSIYALIRANQGYGRPPDCTVSPDIARFGLADLTAADALIAAGRAAAEAQLPQIRRDLGLEAHPRLNV